jgi:superoxide dismutase, Cu-Zn family
MRKKIVKILETAAVVLLMGGIVANAENFIDPENGLEPTPEKPEAIRRAVEKKAAVREEGHVFARANLGPVGGSPVKGTVDFIRTSHGMNYRIFVQNAPEGQHGIHIHEYGSCGGDEASKAGAHYNPSYEPHGGVHSQKHHAGDLGNVAVNREGNGEWEGQIPRAEEALHFSGGIENIVGKSVVLHLKRDDYQTQPAGNSGKRIACGVIERVPNSPALGE